MFDTSQSTADGRRLTGRRRPLAVPAAGRPRTRDGDEASVRLLDQVVIRERQIRRLQAEQVDAVAAYAARQRELYADPDLAAEPGGRTRPGPDEGELCERAIALEVAAAYGVSASSARILVADADDLTGHHRGVLDTLRDGRLGWWAARQIVTATRILPADLAGGIDAEVATEATMLLPGQVRTMVEARVAAVDPDTAARRAALARHDKDVFVVPKPDTMAMLGATLPAEQALACYHALDSHARGRKADGDTRTIAHLMCDTLVERITGAAKADDSGPVEVQVVITDATLLGNDDAPADLVGYGPIPADLARHLSTRPRAWIRRLLTDPLDGSLTQIDTRRRRFDGPLRDLIRIRDRRCRNPVCNARIRDHDHRHDHATGGPTSAANGDGYCQRCHHLKDHPAITVTPLHPGPIPPPPAEDARDDPPVTSQHSTSRGQPGQDKPRAAVSDIEHTRDQLAATGSVAHGIIWTGPSGNTYPSLAPPTLGTGRLPLTQLTRRQQLLDAGTGPPVIDTA